VDGKPKGTQSFLIEINLLLCVDCSADFDLASEFICEKAPQGWGEKNPPGRVSYF
jgi:hypothetical protein